MKSVDAAAPVATPSVPSLAVTASVSPWSHDFVTHLVPRCAGASLPIAAVTVERTIPQAVNLSAGALPPCSATARLAIVRSSIVPSFGLKFAQLALFREMKFAMDKHSPATMAVHAPVAWGITNVPAQSAMYAMAINGTWKHFGMAPPLKGGIAEFVRLKIMPGILWTFLREGFATGGGLTLGPHVQKHIDLATNGALSPFASKFTSGLLAGWACAFATMFPHNCALTAARMAQNGENPTTMSCMRQVMKELGLFRALTLNFQQRCTVIAVVVGCLNTADVMARPDLALVSQ
mmetsp:Transcript_98564/g.275330  ORF Transcript_98564/g.275330 Transcript_98564/m.275330 type:complete len:292 (-) Transcript_98564:402-1277(-)